ncbi:KTSC domain-containing protein [Streptosporangium sp. NPDC000509]|uniref:KTSC domain-containing protein n=1 Tax=Streptosporangium sp. NPDC000509 TaxID=3366186 RepID=UPI0036AAC1F8
MGTVFTPIASDHLQGVHYEPATSVLLIRFSDGSVYQYRNVPSSLFRKMLDAQPHPWSAVGRELRDKVRYGGIRVS